MKGVDDFVSDSLSESESNFDLCVKLIVYGYSLLEKETTYSRGEILKLTSKIRGKKAKKVELEDYLRNELIDKYIMPNRSIFGLSWFLFQSGAEEFDSSIKTGILDIKVCSPMLDGSYYYIFECKRMNYAIIDNYVKEGVARFVESKYYPESNVSTAGMISFLESETAKNKIECSKTFKIFKELLDSHSSVVKIKKPIKKYRLQNTSISFVKNFNFVYVSTHSRAKGKGDLDLFHIILDFNHLIES